MFARALPDLKGTVWTPDLPGHGHASWRPELRRFEDLVAWLDRFLKTEVPPPRLLLGYSMGARLGAVAWMRAPELFEGAVLVGVHPGDLDGPSRDQRAKEDHDRARRLRDDPKRFLTEWDRLPMFGHRGPQERPWADGEALAQAMGTASLAHMPDCRSFLETQDAKGRLELLVGEHDAKFREIWGARGRVIPGAHHDVVNDAPVAVAAAAEALRLRNLPDPD